MKKNNRSAVSAKTVSEYNVGGVIIHNSNEKCSKNIKKILEDYNKLNNRRSIIIADSLDLENSLNICVCHLFFGKDYKRHGWFKGLILEKEFFNFMLKRKLLSDITDFFKDKLSVISSDIFKQVRKDLNDLILIRNKVAHGSIFYDGDREAFYIEYYEGRKKEDKFDDSFMRSFKDKYTFLDKHLRKLNEYIRENDIIK